MNKNSRHDPGIDALKGLAIIFVVLIHVIAVAFSNLSPKSPTWNLALTLDQLSRFSVPLFIALSGYSLAINFNLETHWPDFYFRRLFKLLPIYIFWSLVTYLLISTLGNWPNYQQDLPILPALIYGKVDYHLYFVPMIFQLYLLFPLIYKLTKIGKLKVVLVVLVWQAAFYFYISRLVETVSQNLTLSDQNQYLFFGTWIFYFIFGIYSQLYPNLLKIIGKKSLLAILIFLGYSIFSTNNIFNQYSSILLATRFTKVSVLLYAIAMIIFLLNVRQLISKFNFGLLLKIGQVSFLIYLVHVMVLRAVNIFFLPTDGPSLVLVFFLTTGLSFLLALIISNVSKMLTGFVKQTKLI